MMAADRMAVLHGSTLVGTLWLEGADRFHFRYDVSWISSPEGFEISQSLPMQTEVFEEGPARTFFTNLLPEGALRMMVCRRLGISEGNDFGLLASIGGECAGALSLLPPGEPDHLEEGYRRIEEQEFREMLEGASALPTYTGRDGMRLSLAGAQDKLPVLLEDGEILLPKGRSPSSHILKLPGREFKHLPENEAFVTSLARELGLPVPAIELRTMQDHHFTLIERYDRERLEDGGLVRVHQEDMCQCLALPPSRKYEQEGGPTFATTFEVVSRTSVDPARDIESLIRWQVFNLLVRNADAHAKNLSMLVHGRERRRLAPFYDLVCTGVYGRLDRRLATSIGSTRDPGHVCGRDWEALARSVSVSTGWVKGIVERYTDEIPRQARRLAEVFRERFGDCHVFGSIPELIRKQARRTRQLLDS